MLEALSSYEPELLTCGSPPGGVAEPAARTLAMLADLYDKELVGVIGWAKQIPGFTDLALNDQVPGLYDLQIMYIILLAKFFNSKFTI